MLAVPLAFDLDGTLFDNENVVWQCYLKAGITPPEDFWGKPAKEWLNNDKLHRLKQEFYLKEIRYLRPTPLLKLFYQHGGIILTGASYEAARAICDTWLLCPFELHHSLTLQDKLRILQGCRAGLYFDDRPKVAERVEKETQWQVMLPSSFRLRE